MLLTNFNTLCQNLGDQTLDVSERWMSLKYISIAGQASPGFDFQRLLRENRIFFITNNEIGPGFLILDAANSDMGVININDPVLSFIPLSVIDSVTFMVTKKNEDGSIPSIYELTKTISDQTYDIPVSIRFPNSIYYFKKGEPIKIPVIFNRTMDESDYDIKYLDVEGNELAAKPTDIGRYSLIITCKNGYTGKGIVKFEIQ